MSRQQRVQSLMISLTETTNIYSLRWNHHSNCTRTFVSLEVTGYWQIKKKNETTRIDMSTTLIEFPYNPKICLTNCRLPASVILKTRFLCDVAVLTRENYKGYTQQLSSLIGNHMINRQ